LLGVQPRVLPHIRPTGPGALKRPPYQLIVSCWRNRINLREYKHDAASDVACWCLCLCSHADTGYKSTAASGSKRFIPPTAFPGSRRDRRSTAGALGSALFPKDEVLREASIDKDEVPARSLWNQLELGQHLPDLDLKRSEPLRIDRANVIVRRPQYAAS